MAGVLGATDLGIVDASAWPEWTAGLIAAGRPRLALAQLTGGAIALGRFQRRSTTLTPRGLQAQIVRRLTGGRAVALGRLDEHAVMFALDLAERIAERSEEVVVGVNDGAVELELDQSL